MERSEVLFTVAAEQLDVTEGLGCTLLYGEAPIIVLHVMGSCYNIVGYLKKILLVAAVRTSDKVCNLGRTENHSYTVQ